MDLLKQINEAAGYLREQGIDRPAVGIVLGTGLGRFIDHIKIEQTIAYKDIPHFPEATAESHAGKLIYGTIGAIKILAMQGRFHYYEGYTMQQITFPIRVMKELGVSRLLLSNAAGGIKVGFKKGDLILLGDHINLQSGNPLCGLNRPQFGTIFPDMSQPYNAALNEALSSAANRQNVKLKTGVYASVQGPNLETRAEYRFLRLIGADMVGMSTVPEVIVAAQIGLPCAAVSVITDECDPDNLKPVNIAEIIAVASEADERLSKIFAAAIESFGTTSL